MSETTHVLPRSVSVTTVRHMRALLEGGMEVRRVAWMFGFDGPEGHQHVRGLRRWPHDAELDACKAVRCEVRQ